VDEKKSERSPLEQAEEKRAARKAKLAELRDVQKAIDTLAIDALEETLGDERVKAIDVPFHPGHVAKIACRCPEKAELNVYRSRVKPRRDGKAPDLVAAAEEIGRMCLIYPSEEKFDALLELTPGLLGQLGREAVTLAVGDEENEKKS
jgi:hypothetical protein